MEYLCSICQKPYHPRSWKEDFCNECYHLWEKDIKAKAEWIRVCINTERRRRNQDTYSKNGKRITVQYIYLGSEYDLYGNKLVPLAEHFTGDK